ncbi:MAG: hypothetical protein J3K34DRAFT_465804 [Monoraphidium minutum]|nr:MAG: hypothetical protein J3K34DRAFT_465804 [Monoraphidium minutum]
MVDAQQAGPAPDAPPAAPQAPHAPRAVKTNIWGIPTSCAENVMPHHRAAMPSLEAFRASPHWPVMVTPDPSTSGGITYDGSSDPAKSMPLNGPSFDVDSDFMQGKMMVHIRNLASSDASVFDGKRRSIHVAMQLRVKQRTCAADVCIGGEFRAPVGISKLQGARLAWIVDKLLHVCARVMSRTADVQIGEVTSYLMPSLVSSQLVNVARAGEEPDMLLSPELADGSGAPLAAEEAAQVLLDYPTYMANIAGHPAIDMTGIVASQPVQIMVRDARSGAVSIGLLIWSERLVYPEEYERERARRRAEARVAAGGGGGGWLAGLLHRR